MVKRREKIGEILVEWGVLSTQQLHEANKLAEGSNKRLGAVLVELGFVSETNVAKALARQFGMEYIDLDQPDAIKKENLPLLPADCIKRYLVLPLEKKQGRLKVLIHDPIDIETLDNLRFVTGCEIEPAVGARAKIKDYIDQMVREPYEMSAGLGGDKDEQDGGVKNVDGVEVRQSDAEDQGGKDAADADQAPIIRLVNHIIVEAVNSRASDIHIEPFADRVRLRYRIDGVCHERDRVPKRTQSAVIARMKLMAGVKVEEKRLPQDGRIKLKIGGKAVDFRFSSCPAYHGESCVLRILRAESARIGLSTLGLGDDTLEQFKKIIRRPNGIFLVTGPTGSGKTTTLYSALDVLNQPDRKIITAEDPVEYNFKGINQVQINEQIGLTFAKVLRAMLRQAPNVILVGEIRDKEVADVAIQAALTGHLVFSTLHTNDAPSAIARLIDMGVKPFLVASSLQAVLAQRLVRVLCDHCKARDEAPNPQILGLCGLTEKDIAGQTIYRAVGCSRCSETGYRGRKGVYEMMFMNNELRELAFSRAPVTRLRAAAIASGMRDLLGDGRLKILSGVTTPEEIARVSQVEGLMGLHEEVEEVTAA